MIYSTEAGSSKGGYSPVKSLGQNFLTDFNYSFTMIDALNLEDGDTIVEIGPGLGALTDELAARVEGTKSTLHAIDIDTRFVAKLSAMYLDNLNVNLINADILDWLPNFNPENDFKLIGSLPYYITSPILHSIIKHPKRPKTVVILIQKEVAQKLTTLAPDASYISIFAGTFYDCSLIQVVPKEKFSPAPKVDGAIVKMTKKENPLIANDRVNAYEEFLHQGFSKPRKMLNKVISKDKLLAADIVDTLRPQHLTLDQWLKLFAL